MNRNLVALANIILVVALLALGISCGVMRYNECRRVHPWWYCMGEK